MKRAFVRGLWGIHDNSRRFFKRRAKMDGDIEFLKNVRYPHPFVTYAFGEDNAKYLRSQGYECKQLSKEPIVWDMDTEQFRHKLEIFDAAMDDYDQIVFLDWDTVPIRELPLDFWEVLEKKGSLQAILRMYHRTKAYWRKKDSRKIPCASFVYINDKQVAIDLIKYWEAHGRPWSEEVIMARYIDVQMGGWKGQDAYWEMYEPDFFVLGEGKVFEKEKLATKTKCFSHINKKTRQKLKRVGADKRPKWMK